MQQECTMKDASNRGIMSLLPYSSWHGKTEQFLFLFASVPQGGTINLRVLPNADSDRPSD